MNLNHLNAFVQVSDTQSFKEAARILAVSQPAVTQRIQLLEKHFGMNLLHKDSSGIRLTREGKLLYKQSNKILALWRETEDMILGPEPTGELLVGASTIPSQYLLPEMVKESRLKFPDMRIRAKVAGSRTVYSWLLERKIDIALTGETDESDRVHSRRVFTDNLQLIASKDCPPVFDSISDAMKCDWVLREKDSGTRRSFEEALRAKGISPEALPIVAEMGSTEAVIASVEAGMGVSVVSSLAAKRAAEHRNIRIIDIEDFTVTRPFYLSCLADAVGSPAVSAFFSLMK
ncbi:selenium metabolism-associated LysR family transcriptional regulator [Bacillus marinisedimentorum]|uniref:selenium metabolism-associated LysR family transcriptional regulator n=1 Tax=Bacillus marinisedimentorum TaxID=1821260 RepID=UPI0007E01BA1|nr:selenium metabolism-associated LysR family transcriptional regulator [Bacillus marinisedimentorum]